MTLKYLRYYIDTKVKKKKTIQEQRSMTFSTWRVEESFYVPPIESKHIQPFQIVCSLYDNFL